MQMKCHPTQVSKTLVSLKEVMSVRKRNRSVLARVGQHGSSSLPPISSQLEVYSALRWWEVLKSSSIKRHVFTKYFQYALTLKLLFVFWCYGWNPIQFCWIWHGTRCHKGVGSTYGTRKLSQPGSTAIKFPEQRRDKVSTELGKISDRGEYLIVWRSVCYNSHHLFVKHLMFTRYYSTFLTCMNSVTSQNNPMSQTLLVFPLHWGWNGDTERPVSSQDHTGRKQ